MHGADSAQDEDGVEGHEQNCDLDEGKVSLQIITERSLDATLREELKLDVHRARVKLLDGGYKLLLPSSVHSFIYVNIAPVLDKVAPAGGLGFLKIVHSA